MMKTGVYFIGVFLLACLLVPRLPGAVAGLSAGKGEGTPSALVLDAFRQAALKLIPSARDIPAFAVIRGPAFYDLHNLWDYIDGGALPYLDYGVVGAAAFTGVFVPDSLRFTIDLYHMGADLNAFGIYSSERDAEARFLSIGAEGYRSGPALFFWKGPWYVKILAEKESDRAGNAAEQIARWIEKRIPVAAKSPSLLSLFPVEGKTPRSEKFIAKDVLGQDFLKRGFAVEYTRDNAPYRLFLIDSGDPEHAKEHFQGCREYIRDSGGVDGSAVRLGDEAFTGVESFYGPVLFVRKGNWILVSMGLKDLALARNILDGMIEKLPEESAAH